MKINKFEISNTDTVLVTEEYMEYILEEEGFVIKEDGFVDSNLVCEYADYLGFKNLGDFGYGFVFMLDLNKIEKEVVKFYFNKGE